MTPLVVEAIYENGTLKLSQALPLKEHERVWVTVEPEVSLARATSGLLGWTGDAETVERIALDPEFSVEESR
jgi:predicted DNA-binding antitoxin AbrB/MazE fold protein